MQRRSFPGAPLEVGQRWGSLFVEVPSDSGVVLGRKGQLSGRWKCQRKSRVILDRMCLSLFQNSSQACKCLQTLSENGNFHLKHRNSNCGRPPGCTKRVQMYTTSICCACAVVIQEQLMELDCVLPLRALMKTSSPEPALSLLSVLSAHLPNNVRTHLLSQDVKQGDVNVRTNFPFLLIPSSSW